MSAHQVSAHGLLPHAVVSLGQARSASRPSDTAVITQVASSLAPAAGVLTGPQFPQPATVPPPRGGLPVGDPRRTPPWITEAPWLWVSCHGGAGVTTLTQVISGGIDGGRYWPFPIAGQTARVVLVARTHAAGLEKAQRAAAQWASGRVVPGGVRLLGLVLVRDADGPLPRPLSEYAQLVAGGFPRVWHLPWVKEFRLGEAAQGLKPRRYRELAGDLSAMVAGGQHA